MDARKSVFVEECVELVATRQEGVNLLGLDLEDDGESVVVSSQVVSHKAAREYKVTVAGAAKAAEQMLHEDKNAQARKEKVVKALVAKSPEDRLVLTIDDGIDAREAKRARAQKGKGKGSPTVAAAGQPRFNSAAALKPKRVARTRRWH